MKKANSAGNTQRTRAEINRENAKKSTGPRTPGGKTASSRNAFKHGLHSKTFMLDGEDPAELDELRRELRSEHQPANTTEEILVNEMAESFIRIRRTRKSEAKLWQSFGMESWERWQPLMLRIMNSAERAFHKSLHALRQLQNERRTRMHAAIRHQEPLAVRSSLDAAPVLHASSGTRGFVPQKATESQPARRTARLVSPKTIGASRQKPSAIKPPYRNEPQKSATAPKTAQASDSDPKAA